MSIGVLKDVVTESAFATGGSLIASTITPTAVDAGDSFPAASVAFAVMLCGPSDNNDETAVQNPSAVAVVEPMVAIFVPSESDITIPANALWLECLW